MVSTTTRPWMTGSSTLIAAAPTTSATLVNSVIRYGFIQPSSRANRRRLRAWCVSSASNAE